MEPLARAISLVGSQAALARRIGAVPQQVQEWKDGDRPIPPLPWCPRIEEATGGEVRCEDLLPNIAWIRKRGKITGYTVSVQAA